MEDRSLLQRLDDDYRNERSARRVQLVTGKIQDSYIYLVSIGQGHFKIGRSIKPKRRLVELQVSSPFQLVLLHKFFCCDSLRVERELQELFGARKIRGEIYSLSDRQITFIKSIDESNYWNLLEKYREEML